MSYDNFHDKYDLDGEEFAQERTPRRPAPGKRTLTSRLAGAAPAQAVIRQVEQTTGSDLSGVRVHTGADSSARAADLEARAFTTGNDIHFGAGQFDPGTRGGARLLAHELVHTLQQGGQPPTTQRKAEVSQPGDGAEREADHIASVALDGHGSSAPLRPVERAAPIAREAIAGNPRDRRNRAGTANTTAHRAPTIGDSINHQAPGAAGGESRAANVKINATPSAPLHLEPPVCPATELVYEEAPAGDASSSAPPSGFTAVTEFRGTLLQPMIEEEADPGIYINNQPTANDVQQMGIGDCYFLSSIMSIVQRDVGKITSMITADGNGGATVSLWRRQTHVKTFWEHVFGGPAFDYIPVQITVNEQLAFNTRGSRLIHGAQLRSAETAKSSDYWGDINGSALELHRKDVFECARWAPLLEKAFALFGQTYGQYGGARPGKAAGGSGYDVIDGGVPMYAYFVFYGPEADKASAGVQRQNTTWTPGGNVLAANPFVVNQLLLLAGRGDTPASGATDAPILTAQVLVDPLITRLGLAIPVAQADPDYANISATRQTHIASAATAIAAWTALPPDPAPPAAQPKAAARIPVGNACALAVRPGAPNQAGLGAIRRAAPATVQFDQGGDEVAPADVGALGAFRTALTGNATSQVTVDLTGRSSSEGTEASNQDLSQRRADNVETAMGPVPPHTVTKSAQGEAGADRTAAWRRVDVAVSPAEATNNLHGNTRSVPIRGMMDLMLDLRNIGTDASTGQRNIYGGHSYSVVAVSFIDITGQSMPLQAVAPAMRPALYSLVDTNASTVRLRNPHHGNEPDRLGNNQPTRPSDGAPSGAGSDGTFTMSLEEFFRNFTAVDSAVLPRT